MQLLKVLVTIVLIAAFSFPRGLQAQPQDRSDAPTHVVSLDQLRTTLAARTAERGRNIQEIQKLLRHEEVRAQVRALADLDKIERTIPTLDDTTLARLAGQSRQVNDQIEAGISTLGWVGIAVGAAVLVLLLVCSANPNGVCFGG